MGPTWISLARVLKLRVPIAWQEAVHVARAAFLASEARSCRLTLEGCLISTGGQVRVGEHGADRIGNALSELQLLKVLLDGQKVPRELGDILASADDALSGFPSEEDPSPQGLSLEWFVGTEPAVEIARLAARAVDADRGIVTTRASRRAPVHPLGTDYEPPPFGGRPPSESGIAVAEPPRPSPASPVVPVPPPVVPVPPPVPPTAPRDGLAAFPSAGSPGREPAPGLALEAPPREAPPQARDSREQDEWRLEWLIDRASAAVSDLRTGEPLAVGVAAGVVVLAATAAAVAWLGSAPPVPPLESRALAVSASYAPTVTPDVSSAPPGTRGQADRGIPGASPAAAGSRTGGLVARSSSDAVPMRLTPMPAAVSATAPPAVASSPGSAKPPAPPGPPPSPRPADAGIASGLALPELRVYSAEDPDVEPPVWRRPQLPSEPKLDSEPSDSFVELLVNERGEVAQVRLHSTDMSLNDRMILAAVKAWQFRPAMKDGRPVPYVLRMPVTR